MLVFNPREINEKDFDLSLSLSLSLFLYNMLDWANSERGNYAEWLYYNCLIYYNPIKAAGIVPTEDNAL